MYQALDKRRLGTTDLMVPNLCFGMYDEDYI